MSAVNAAPGDLDLTFSGDGKIFDYFDWGGDDTINDIAFQADGKIIVAGNFTYGGLTACRVNRYNQDGTLDPFFDAVLPMGSQFFCYAVEIQADGKIVVLGGTPGVVLLRFNSNGTLDTSFDGDGKLVPANVCSSQSLAIQPDGKYLIGGNCGFFGNRDFGVTRFNTNGSLDTSFDGDGRAIYSVSTDDGVADVAVQSDGKIVAVGFASGGAGSDFATVRYNTDGSLDTSFDGDGIAITNVGNTSESPNSVTIQSDGKIIAAGSTFSGTSDFALVRYNTNGSLDTSFDTDGIVVQSLSNWSDAIIEVKTQTDSKILAVGTTNPGSSGDFALVRYNTNGSPDTTFDTDGVVTTNIQSGDQALTMAVQSDGRIVAAGSSTNSWGDKDFTLVRYNTDGSLDTSFDSDGKTITQFSVRSSSARAMVIQPDGKIIAAGQHSPLTSNPNFAIARYNTNGALDWKTTASVAIATDTAKAVALQPDGKIVAAGPANTGSDDDFGVARLNSNGSLDTSFDGDGMARTGVLSGNDTATSVAIQPDGKIVVAGYSRNGSNDDIALVRFNANGSLDTSFDGDGKVTTAVSAGGEDAAYGIAILPDGKILVAGYAWGTTTDIALVRYNPNGSLDTSFDGDGIVLAPVSGGVQIFAMTRATDGKIIVAGRSGSASSSNFALARFNPDGSLDTSFDGDGKLTTNLGSEDIATAVAVQPNGKIIAAGYATISSSADFALVRYNPDGSLDTSYSGDGKAIFDHFDRTDEWINGMALDSSGRAVVAGETEGIFTLARILGDPSISSPFDFDGDTRTDISIFRPSAGEWWYLRSSDGGNGAFAFGSSTDKIVPGDFTGDGKTDAAFFRPSTGEWFVLRSEDYSYYSFPFGISTDVPTVGDFDGDDMADPAVYRASEGNWYIRRSTNGGTEIQQFGIAGDVPVPADYDADGKTDNAIYRPSNGQWWVRRSSNDSVFAFTFGTSSDRPVQGDYTGDGKADAAFFRPSTGEWFVQRSEDFSYYSVPFGASGDIPTPGDYDGDGKFDTAVFRPSGSTWYVNRSTSGLLIVGFGASGDMPVPSAFVP